MIDTNNALFAQKPDAIQVDGLDCFAPSPARHVPRIKAVGTWRAGKPAATVVEIPPSVTVACAVECGLDADKLPVALRAEHAVVTAARNAEVKAFETVALTLNPELATMHKVANAAQQRIAAAWLAENDAMNADLDALRANALPPVHGPQTIEEMYAVREDEVGE